MEEGKREIIDPPSVVYIYKGVPKCHNVNTDFLSLDRANCHSVEYNTGLHYDIKPEVLALDCDILSQQN